MVHGHFRLFDKRRRTTLIGAGLPEYPDRVRFRNSADLTRDRPCNVRCGSADQNRYHGCANGEPQELH